MSQMNPFFVQGFQDQLRAKLAEGNPEVAAKLADLGLAGSGEGGEALDAAPNAGPAGLPGAEGPSESADDAQKVLDLINQLPEEERMKLLQQLMATMSGGGEPGAPEQAIAEEQGAPAAAPALMAGGTE